MKTISGWKIKRSIEKFGRALGKMALFQRERPPVWEFRPRKVKPGEVVVKMRGIRQNLREIELMMARGKRMLF